MPLLTQLPVAAWKIRVNGADLPPYGVVALTVEESVSALSTCTVQFTDISTGSEKISWSDDRRLAPGNAIEIQMGYQDALTKLMAGEIVGLEAEFPGDDAATVTVRGYDRGYQLQRGTTSRGFLKMKDSEVAAKMAADAGLQVQADDSGLILDYVQQVNQSDLEFLRARALRIDYEVIVRDKTLYFRQRPRPTNGGQTVTLARTQDMLEFALRKTTISLVDTVEVRAVSPIDKEVLVGQARLTGAQAAAGGKSPEIVIDQTVSSLSEADTLARARLNQLLRQTLTGTGACVGRTDLRAGTFVQIAGYGNNFSANYYVTAVTHSYSPRQGYRTTFEVELA